MTPLAKTLKRSLTITGVQYVVTLAPDALRLTRKGKRLGLELKWTDITSGESALALALQASVVHLGQENVVRTSAKRRKKAAPTKRSRQ